MWVGAPPSGYLPQDVKWAVERLAYLRGRIEKLSYDLQPYWTYIPGSEEVFGFKVSAEPEPGTLAMELLKWSQRSAGHDQALRSFRTLLGKVVHEMADLWKLIQNLYEQDIPTLDRLYFEGYYQGLMHPPAKAPYGSAMAAREGESLLRDWESLGYYLEQSPSLRPVFEAYEESHKLSEFVDQLEDFFLTEVPPEARLQPRDWQFY